MTPLMASPSGWSLPDEAYAFMAALAFRLRASDWRRASPWDFSVLGGGRGGEERG